MGALRTRSSVSASASASRARRGGGLIAPQRRTAATATAMAPSHAMSAGDLLELQRSVGNQAVQRMVGPSPTLRAGSRGQAVADLQQQLVAAGASLTPDGAFGPKTRAAVIAFQRSAGLGADGVVGPKTWDALRTGGVRIGPGGKPDGRMDTLMALLAAIKERTAARATAAPPGIDVVQPEPRFGWFDDATDWVEDKASDAADWVGEQASNATDWVEDKVEQAVDTAGDFVENAVDDAGGWIEENIGADPLGDAGAKLGSLVDDVTGAAGLWLADLGEMAGDLPPSLQKLLDSLGGLALGGDVGANGATIDQLIEQASAAYAELTGEADPQGPGGKGATLDWKVTKGTAPNFTFDNSSFPSLRATLTARTEEIGSALPSSPAITINGQDATKLPSDELVKTAKVSITESITLPVWTNENGPQVQDAQRAEWKRYVGAVSAHEDLHEADDHGIYSKAVAALPGKTVAEAFQAINDATDAGNKQGPVRDKSNPAPILNPAGVEKG